MTRRNLTPLPPLAALALVALLAGCSGDKPEALVASAKGLLAKDDTNAAIIQLRNALQKNPDFAEARLLLGKAQLKAGQFADAQKELRRALELGRSPDEVVPLLAETMLGLRAFKQLIEEFGATGATKTEGLPISLTTPEARADLQTTLGRAHLGLGDFEGAKAAFATATVAKPDHPPALLGQAELAASVSDFPGALALVESALAKSPMLADAWELKGRIQQVQGQQDAALASYRKALDAKRDLLPAHSAIVSLLTQQGKLEEASKQLDAMRTVAPKHQQVLYLQAQLAYKRKDFAAARESIQQLLKVAPGNLAGLLLAGAIDFELKSYAQAEANLLRVLSASPNQPLARRLLVGTYLRAGQPGKALELLKPALDKIGNDSDMLAVAGEVYLHNGNTKEAARYFEKATALDPKNASKKTTLAIMHLAQGGASQAVRELEQAAVEDTTARSDLVLIAVYMRQREYAKALTAIDALEKRQPDDPLPHSLRGQVLLEQNDFPGARKNFERALSINPAYFPAAERLARLDLADKKPADAKKLMETVLVKDPKQTQALLTLADIHGMAGGSADEVATLIGKAIATNPTESAPRLALIAHYLRSKDTRKAVGAAQDAKAAIPDRPEILEALGQAQQAAGDTNQAIVTYGTLARLQPDSPLPWLRIAEAQIAAKDTEAALQSLRKALELRPDLVDAQRKIIALHLAANRTPQALAIAREVQKQRPKESIGFLLEGEIHASKQAWAQAAAAYRAGLKQGPSTGLTVQLHGVLVADGKAADATKLATSWLKDHPKDIVFRTYIADSALGRNDFATAQQHYRALLDIDPDNIAALNNLAWAAWQTKDPKALEYAEKAYALAPNQPAVMDTLGTLLVESGDAARGVELLRKASNLAPDTPVLRLNLAKGLIKANQKDAARMELEQLAKLGDKFPAQAEVTKLMQGL